MLQAGISAATVAATAPTSAAPPDLEQPDVVGAEPVVEQPLERGPGGDQDEPATATPAAEPTSPVTVPCSTRVERSSRPGRPARGELAERHELPAGAGGEARRR